MRKIQLSVALVVLTLSLSKPCTGQTFQKGSLVVAADFGVDAYSILYTEVHNYSMTTQSKSGGAASRNFNLGAEFGVVKWLGLGLQFKFDKYFVSDSDKSIQSVYGVEYGLIVNFHIVRHLHFDFLAGLNLGASNLTINYKFDNDQVYGSGSWDDIHFTTRVYLNRFGFSATLYIPTINYSNLSSNVSVFNEYVYATFKAKGAGLNLGVQYHFLQ